MQADERIAELSWIYDLYRRGQDVLKSGDLHATYDLVLRRLMDELGAACGMLAWPEEGGLAVVAAQGCPCRGGLRRHDAADGAGMALEEGQPLLLNGGCGSNDNCFVALEKVSDPDARGNIMCWPLKAENAPSGALCLCSAPGQAHYSFADLHHGNFLVNLVTVMIENMQLHVEQLHRIEMLSQKNSEILDINKKLEQASNQLLQSEKMASIGQLAAGVAHEINNPIGYVYSNLGTLQKYLHDVFGVLEVYEKAEPQLAGQDEALAAIREAREKADIDFLKGDILALMDESREGIVRVKKIVQDLKDFSHVGADEEWQWADLHKGLDSTLNIVWNELKYKCEVNKEYGDLPPVYCLPSQLNQVFMNLLVNAAHAIETHGVITLRSGTEGDGVWLEVADSGKGIPPENLSRIFDPFFTTKPVGKGTGLGLSVSYSIVEKHHGRIEVRSEVGKGTAFRIWLPLGEAENGVTQ